MSDRTICVFAENLKLPPCLGKNADSFQFILGTIGFVYPANTAASLRSGRLPRSLPSERGKRPERGEAAVIAG